MATKYRLMEGLWKEIKKDIIFFMKIAIIDLIKGKDTSDKVAWKEGDIMDKKKSIKVLQDILKIKTENNNEKEVAIY